MRINSYNKHYKDGDDWLKVDFSLEGYKWLNYQISSEIIECFEIDLLIEAFTDLLSGKLKEDNYIELIEPDLVFVLKPKFDIRESERVLYVRERFEMVDVSMTMEVHFWDDEGVLSANYMSEDIEHLLHYLKLISGKENADDDAIVKRIEEGIILTEYKL